MNSGKLVSGVAALIIYLSLIFLVLYFYNIHQTKAKNYVEKNSDRVTVTLVNSDKTVLNRKDKTSNPKKPVPKRVIPTLPIPKKNVRPSKHIPKKAIPKKIVPKKVLPKKRIPKKRVVVKRVPKKTIPKKIVPKREIVKKKVPKKVVPSKKKLPPKKIIPKKRVPKNVIPPKKKLPPIIVPERVVQERVVPKRVVQERIVPKRVVQERIVPKRVPKKTAKDLFSSIKTQPVKKRPVRYSPNRPVVEPSAIRHNSSMTDRIRATHQSGRVSNANRETGVENAYIAKVKRDMMNWNAVGASGQWVTVHLTIFNSGKFRYTSSGVSGAMKSSLEEYLDTLNRIGLGRHKKSTPYSIQVRFRVR